MKARRTLEKYICSEDSVDVSSVIWKDNKSVALLSTFVGKFPESQVQRYDKKEKRTVEIPCPRVIIEYNKHMGGVDLMGSNIGRYTVSCKSRK